MYPFKSIIAFLLLSVVFFGCTTNYDSGYESTLTNICEARISGDYDNYLSYLGGNLLYNAFKTYSLQRKFIRRAKLKQRKGISLQEIFIKSKSFNASKLSMKVSFLEKLSYESGAFWTVAHNWQLEYIDCKWRVVKF